MKYTVAKKPQSIKQTLKQSFCLYREHWLSCVGIALLISFVNFLPRFLSYAIGPSVLTTFFLTNPGQVVLLLLEVISLIFFTALLWHQRCAMYKKQETLEEDMTMSLKRLPRIIGAALIQSILLLLMIYMSFGTYILFKGVPTLATTAVPPAWMVGLTVEQFFNMYLFGLFILYLPLILTENKHIFEALYKSAVLVWGNWWRTVITLLTPWLVYVVALIIIKYTLRINIHIYFMESEGIPLLFPTIIHFIIYAFYIPWFAATMLVLLHDLELRKNQKLKKQKR